LANWCVDRAARQLIGAIPSLGMARANVASAAAPDRPT
jgi:hypothetical protein